MSRSPWQFLLGAGATAGLTAAVDPSIRDAFNPASDMGIRDRAMNVTQSFLPYRTLSASSDLGFVGKVPFTNKELPGWLKGQKILGQNLSKAQTVGRGFTNLAKGLGRMGPAALGTATALGLPYLATREAGANYVNDGVLKGGLKNYGNMLATGIGLRDMPSNEPVSLYNENMKTQQMTANLGQFAGSPYSMGQNASGQVVTNLPRTNPLTGAKFSTDYAGDKYVLLEKPNPLRPNEMQQTYVTQDSIKGGLPVGSKIAGYGYQVMRPSPLTGKLQNTIVSERDLVNMGGTPVRPGEEGMVSRAGAYGDGGYGAAMGAANSEYNLGKKAAQRDLTSILQQLGQTATGVGLDTSMAAAQAGMDTSPGALDVGLDSINTARAQGEAGARGDFAKVLGQLEQRRLRQQASAAQSRAQAYQNNVFDLMRAQLGYGG
jgi:hypothetical protein